MKLYKGYNVYDKIPEGWRELKSVGTPVHGYVYIYNGIPPIKGGIIGLTHITNLPTKNKQIFENQQRSNKDIIENKEKKQMLTAGGKNFVFEASQAKIVNSIARKKNARKVT